MTDLVAWQAMLDRLDPDGSARDVRRVRFQGQEYLRIGGAIATREQYETGADSYAHIFGDEVKRYGVVIGRTDEVEDLGADRETEVSR